jgi:hypothetical protein
MEQSPQIRRLSWAEYVEEALRMRGDSVVSSFNRVALRWREEI